MMDDGEAYEFRGQAPGVTSKMPSTHDNGSPISIPLILSLSLSLPKSGELSILLATIRHTTTTVTAD